MRYHDIEKLIESVEHFGALGYSVQKAISILRIYPDEVDAFTEEWNQSGSIINVAYWRGKDKHDLKIDLELAKMAEAGDIKSIEKLQERKVIREDEIIERTSTYSALPSAPQDLIL